MIPMVIHGYLRNSLLKGPAEIVFDNFHSVLNSKYLVKSRGPTDR